MAHGIALFTRLLLAIALIAASGIASAKDALKPRRDSYVPTADELFKDYKPAVVKITLRQSGIPVSVGSGFFLAEDGTLVTNHHVVRNAIASQAFTAEFQLADGKIVKDYRVRGCGDKRGIDLCVLKLPVRSPKFFAFSDKKPKAGDGVYVLGHPRGLDFSLTRGKITAVRVSPLNVEELEISAPLGPGNSGGPIYDDMGRLLGIATKYWPERESANYGITAVDLKDFEDSVSEPLPVSRARSEIAERTRIEMGNKAVAELDPVLNLAIKGKVALNPEGFSLASFDFDGQVVQTLIPSGFETCRKTPKSPTEAPVYACFGFGDSAFFTAQRTKKKPGEKLLKKDRKRLLEEKPGAVAQTFIEDGSWEKLSKGLSPAEKKEFYSHPKPAECRPVGNKVPGAFFGASSASCRFEVANDMEARAKSFNVWVESGDYVYSFGAWMSDPSMEEYFAHVPTLAILTAKAGPATSLPVPRTVASTLSAKRLDTYELTLSEPFHFMGGKPVKGGGYIDYYGKRKTIGTFDDDYFLTVTSRDETVLPPKFDRLAKELALANAKELGLNAKIVSQSATEPLKVFGKPARLVYLNGANRLGNQVNVVSVSVFDNERVYVIAQVTIGRDLPESYKELKALLGNFKAK